MSLKLLLFFFLISSITFGQSIQIQSGASTSFLDWQFKGASFDMGYDQPLITPDIFIGINYITLRYFNLSTNIGFISKGGRSKNSDEFISIPREPGQKLSKLNYFSWNALVEFKYPLNEEWSPFISAGPRIDYLNSVKGEIKDIDAIKNKMRGFILGAGIINKKDKTSYGLRIDYYFNRDKIADWPAPQYSFGGLISDNTITLNLFVAYDIKGDPWKKGMKRLCRRQWGR